LLGQQDDKEPVTVDASTVIKDGSGNGLARVGNSADDLNKGKLVCVVPEVQSDARPKSTGERKSRQWSGERRSRHPSKEKDPAIPKSERLYNELREAVANDSAPRTRSIMKQNSLTANSRLRGLHDAVRRGSNKAAKAILEVEPTLVHQMDPNSGNTALLVAVEAATISTMSLLVDRGARLSAKNQAGETVWDVARRLPHDNRSLVSTLVGLFKQHSTDYHTTPVHEAAAAGDVDKIDFLVDAGLELWEADRRGYSFIHVAAFNNRTNIIRCYMRHFALPVEMRPRERDVDCRNTQNGKTALHVAANRGHIDSILALVECGADIAAVDNGRWTSLHDAAVCRNEIAAAVVIQTIYSRMPSLVFARTTDGETPLHVAARHGRLGAVESLLQLSVDSGEALSMQDGDGWTPLHSAVESRRPEVVRVIVDAMNTTFSVHSLLELPDRLGRSPLQLAQSLPGAADVVTLLMSYQRPGTVDQAVSVVSC